MEFAPMDGTVMSDFLKRSEKFTGQQETQVPSLHLQ